MHGTTIDRRVKKTKKQLRLALMHLMTQKSAKSISVRELAEQADICLLYTSPSPRDA